MREDSVVSQIAKLDFGASYAKAYRLPTDQAFTVADLSRRADQLADILRPAATRASAKTGYRYVVETHYHVSRARSVAICGIVTRTA